MKNRILTIVTISTFVAGCVFDSRTPKEISTDDIAANYVNIAHAAYDDSLNAAKILQVSVNEFIATPSEENLLLAKTAYKALRIPYQQSEIMRFDSMITVGKNLDADGGPASVDEWEGQVNAWPLDENHIDSLIAGSDAINVDLLLAQNGADDNDANVTTGIHAVEYMLWGSDFNGTDAGAGTRPLATLLMMARVQILIVQGAQITYRRPWIF